MTDRISPAHRSWNMSRIRGKDTAPEIRLRKMLHRAGYRFRLHAPDLPGKPDIVLPKYRAAIFVHGCFWHGHNCHLFRMPATRTEFWRAKIAGNRHRDDRVREALLQSGWRRLAIWECALKGRERLEFASVLDQVYEWIEGDEKDTEISGTNVPSDGTCISGGSKVQ